MTPQQEQLVLDHMKIVPAIARQLVKRLGLPYWIDIDEMVSCGNVGLCRAALQFDPERGVQFGTYAHFKIRASIIDDFLRKQAPICAPMGKDDIASRRVDIDSLLPRAKLDEYEPSDPTPSIEEILIEAQEQRRKCRHLAFASKSVTKIELRAAVSKHSEGKTLREIGAEQGRSASWAHYRVHCGERQLREALLDPEGETA
jgi:RNA polymerase sigma factor (sigma-70 family)